MGLTKLITIMSQLPTHLHHLQTMVYVKLASQKFRSSIGLESSYPTFSCACTSFLFHQNDCNNVCNFGTTDLPIADAGVTLIQEDKTTGLDWLDKQKNA